MGNSFIGKTGERVGIVSEQNATFIGCPFKHDRIVNATQSRVLYAHDVSIWEASQYAADNVHVEVLVHRKTQHCSVLSLASGNKACADARLRETLFILVSD